MTPSVSVIIPVYNTSKYLDQCIKSVLNQTLKNIEIIVVDDGSTDGSTEIIKEYASLDSRIMPIYNSVSSGNPGTPRNQALKIAKGEYIGFVDSDDWVEASALEYLYLLSKENNNDVVITSGYWEEYEGYRRSTKIDLEGIDANDKNLLLTKYHSLALWDKLFRRTFIEVYQIRMAETKINVDIPFVICSLLLCESISILDGTFYHYRQDVEGSTLHKRKLGHSESTLIVYEEIDKKLKEYNVYEQYANILLYSRLNSLFHLFSQVYNWKKKIDVLYLVQKEINKIDFNILSSYLNLINKIDLLNKLTHLNKFGLLGFIFIHVVKNKYILFINKMVRIIKVWLNNYKSFSR